MSWITRARMKYGALIAVTVAAGLTTRVFKARFPATMDALGDGLWAMMIFLLISFAWPTAGVWRRAGAALAFAFAVEFSQIYHAPWIDRIRRTTVGATVLGFTFDWKDLMWYTAGVVLGVIVSRAKPFPRNTAASVLLLFIASGCARSISADETQGRRLFAENVKHPAVGTLSDAEIQTILQDNVGLDGQADGLVVGVVDERGTRIVAAGELSGGTDHKVDGDTLFRIGSITKVFTALLLQDMVDRGEMKLDDPVHRYLPASVKVPTRGGREITLFDLATHTSGLGRDGGSYATVDAFYEYLSRCKLRNDPGTVKEYSNFGFGLLGHVIARRAGKDYETLVIERICTPLGMHSTRARLTPELTARMARGHAYPGRPAEGPRGRGLLLGSGSLRSSANDLSRFISASLGLTPSPLTPLLQRAQAVHRSARGREDRLAWFDDGDVINHGGEVTGFRVDIAFDVRKRRGIVLLANCSQSRIRGVFMDMLNARSPHPPRVAAIEPKLLDNYVGEYRAKDSECIIRRDGDRLLFQWWPGKIGYSLPTVRTEGFAQSNKVFYNQLWTDPARFVCDANGKATRLIMKETVWRKTATQPREFRPVRTGATDFDGCVGCYRPALFGLIPIGPTVSIYREDDDSGGHLMGHVPGQFDNEPTELFPITRTTVITPDLDGAWITFHRDRRGRASRVRVHLNGKDISGVRISDRPILPAR